MGVWSGIRGSAIAAWSALRHLFHPRMTLRYPEQKLDLEDTPYPVTPRRPAGLPPGYKYDPKEGVGLPGFKGRHILILDKCTGCDLCAIACDGIAVAIEMQHIPKGLKQNRREIWPAVDYGRCVPPDTPIVAYDGIKAIKDVKVGDRVLTHTGVFRTVTQLFRRNYTGKLYTLRTLGNVEPLTTTEDHPILIYTHEGTTWAYPDKIGYRTYLTRPIIKEEIPAEKIDFTYELYHPSGRGGHFTTELVSIRCTPELLRLIGYYLAEGHADRYRVSFDINKREALLEQDIVASAAKVFGERVSVKPDKRSLGLKLVIDSVRVASFFSQFGNSCDTKAVPGRMLLMPAELQKELVKAVFAGDGRYSDKRYSYMHSNYFTIRTTSRLLATQLLHIIGRLGIVTSVSEQHQTDRKVCYSVTVHTPYVEKMAEVCGVKATNNGSHSHSHIHMEDGMVVSPVIRIEVKEVEDFEVMNLEVDGDNSYVAANQAVHNCVFCGLCVDACPFDALYMTNDYELAAYDKASLKYTPDMLAVPPKLEGKTYKVKMDPEKGTTSHG